MDFEIAGNAGYQATGEPCVADGPVAYFSTLPLRTILHALVADGVPAYRSGTARTHLCKQTVYTTRHLLERRGLTLPAGFIIFRSPRPWSPRPASISRAWTCR